MLTLIRLLLPVATVIVALVMSLIQLAHAEGTSPSPAMRMPNQQDLEAAKRDLPSATELQSTMAARAQTGLPRVPLAPLSGASAPINLGEMAEQYERMQKRLHGDTTGDQEAEERQASGLMIFVSLSMPRPSLERLLADAERLRAPLVLRGVQNSSLKYTAAQIKALMSEHKVAWSIDPALFKRFEVTSVPTLVLIDPSRPVIVACGSAQCQRPSYSKVSGDVTVRYALEQIEQRDPEFDAVAKRYVSLLEGRP